MDLKQLTAPCGMPCFSCQVYEGNITEEMKTYMAQLLKKEPAEIPCQGCRPKEGKCMLMAGDCATWQCAEDHGVSFCYECKSFPCDHLAPTKDRAEKLPHNMKVYNLCVIQNRGIEAFAKETPRIRRCYYEGRMVIGAGPKID